MVVVSYMTAQPDYATIQNLTFATKTKEDRAATRASWDWREVAASGFVLACILGAYLYFRGSPASSAPAKAFVAPSLQGGIFLLGSLSSVPL
jgi:hypothetical protein